MEVTGTQKERYDKVIRKREKLAGYLYDMSKITFTTAVLANLSVFALDLDWFYLVITIAGLFATVIFAWLANRLFIF